MGLAKEALKFTPHGRVLEMGGKLLASRRSRIALGVSAAVLAGVVTGGWDGIKHATPPLVTHTLDVVKNNAEVVDIDTDLIKISNTAYTAHAQTTSEYALKFGGVPLYKKSDAAEFDVDVALTMEGNTAKASYDINTNHMTVHVDSKNITTATSIHPDSIKNTMDEGNFTTAIADNFSNSLRAIPVAGDAGFLGDYNKSIDGVENTLLQTNLVYGTKNVADKCTPQVWPTTYQAFADNLKTVIRVGAEPAVKALSGKELTNEDVTVLIGNAKTEADNKKQKIGDSSDIDAAYNKLQSNYEGKENLSQKVVTGECKVSDDLKQQTAKKQEKSGASNE